MKRMLVVTAALVVVAGTGYAFTDDGSRRFSEFLNGLKEAPAVVSTTGTGTFEATINPDGTEIAYALTFSDLEGDVLQAHIHIGHPQNSGGIVLWICGSESLPGPAGTPRCNEDNPADNRNGKVSGTLTADDVLAVAANGIAAAELTEVLDLIKAGRTYVNVHSAKFGAGEIRSQIDDRGPGADQGHDHR